MFTALAWRARMIHPASRFSTENLSCRKASRPFEGLSPRALAKVRICDPTPGVMQTGSQRVGHLPH
jgi:hypothetical protein